MKKLPSSVGIDATFAQNVGEDPSRRRYDSTFDR